MKKSGSKLEFDDAFTPKSVSFKECDTEIKFFIDGESIRICGYEKEQLTLSMRLPLYAGAAVAQMFTGTLNGQKLLK